MLTDRNLMILATKLLVGNLLRGLLGAKQALADHGAHVIIASRSLDRTQAAAQKIMVRSRCAVCTALRKQTFNLKIIDLLKVLSWLYVSVFVVLCRVDCRK